MTHLVRTLKDFCTSLDIHFEYGTKANINLIDQGLEAGKIYFLCDPITISAGQSQLKTNVNQTSYIGSALLVVGSNIDMPYFTESGNDDADSKFTQNIEPLAQVGLNLNNKFACTDMEVSEWKMTETNDVLDGNFDGYLINFKVNVPIW